jgi:hypothetical protein
MVCTDDTGLKKYFTFSFIMLLMATVSPFTHSGKEQDSHSPG